MQAEPSAEPVTLAARLRTLRDSLAWAWRLAWATSPRLLAGVAAVTLGRGLIPAGLAASARGIVDAVVAGAAGGGSGALVPWLIVGFALTVTESLSNLGLTLLRDRLRDVLNRRLTGDLLEHAATLELAYLEDPRAQDRLHRARESPAAQVTLLLCNALGTLSMLLQAGSLLAILVFIEPWVVVVLLVLLLPYLRDQWHLAAERHALEHTRTAKRRWTSYFTGLLTGAATAGEVQLLRLAPLLIGRFRALMEEFRRDDWRLAWRGFRRGGTFAVLGTAAIYLAFVRVAWGAMHGAVSIGDVAIFGAATARLRFALELLAGLSGNLLADALRIADVRAVLATPGRDEGPAAPAPAAPVRAALELRDVSFTYPGAAQPALDGVTLSIAAGETVALVGENGAGKSTLVKLLARLYDPAAGVISFDGIDLRDWPRAGLQRQIACVFQGYGRYEASAADNIAFGDWERLGGDRAAVAAVARAAGVEALIAGLPHGYDTVLGRQFGERDLSAGQWQKLAVARAFARDAALLILDEPTASLDARAEHALFEQFRALAHGRTTIIVSHRFSTVAMAHRIVVMHAGRILEQGTHAELLARGGQYATLHDLHQSTRLRVAG